MGAAGVHDTGGERESGSSELFNYEMLHAASPLSLLPLSLLLFLSPKASVSKPPLLLNFHLGSRKIRETNMKKTIKHRHRNQTRTDDKDKITSILIRRPDNNVLITINYPPQCGNTRRCYQPPPLLQSYISGPLSYKIFDYVNISFPRHCASLGTPGPRLAFSKQTATFMNAFVMQHHTNISFHRKPFMMRRIT